MAKTLRLLSWNVNGLRAVAKKGFVDWLERAQPDVLAIQEVRAELEQLPAGVKSIAGYHAYFSAGERKGYSGTAIYTREKPVSVERAIGQPFFDNEGRFLIADYGELILYNIYFPNGSASRERLDYKLAFYEAFLDHVRAVNASGREIVLCGDLNTAHKEIDLARPKENENHSGFLPQEREWIDRLIEAGFIDTFRMFDTTGGHYTYWDFKTRARARNVGWRIDYFFVSAGLADRVENAFILSDVMGSDHCPTGIDIRSG